MFTQGKLPKYATNRMQRQDYSRDKITHIIHSPIVKFKKYPLVTSSITTLSIATSSSHKLPLGSKCRLRVRRSSLI